MSMTNWLEDLPKFPRLAKGAHEATDNEMCAMELIAFMEREPHSDKPTCTCPVLASFVRTLNDRMPDYRRNDLLPVLPRLVGTRNRELERPRGALFTMRIVTDLVPLALDGVIDAELVRAMREAQDLTAAYAAARAATYASGNAAADASANAEANAAANAAAIAAAIAAANAADAAAGKHDFWAHAVQILVQAIELDPSHAPAAWDTKRALTAPMKFDRKALA